MLGAVWPRTRGVPAHIGNVFATVARWRLPVRAPAACRAHPRRGRSFARQRLPGTAPAPSTATAVRRLRLALITANHGRHTDGHREPFVQRPA
ncbi:MAG: hypothetical protein EBR82_02820 [Caulobacteraceae bacterium]|nr:hypothetical protein [Caulobacteraceae bacterium]